MKEVSPRQLFEHHRCARQRHEQPDHSGSRQRASKHHHDEGADDVSFAPIVASGPNAALPHHHPGERGLGAGETVVVDLGAKVDGYSFSGFIRSEGLPVKDLNDFALIDPDQWEAKREAIEEAFSFST